VSKTVGEDGTTHTYYLHHGEISLDSEHDDSSCKVDEENNNTAILELPPLHEVEPFNALDTRDVDEGHFQIAKLV
jgi:hypothetical protein